MTITILEPDSFVLYNKKLYVLLYDDIAYNGDGDFITVANFNYPSNDVILKKLEEDHELRALAYENQIIDVIYEDHNEYLRYVMG